MTTRRVSLAMAAAAAALIGCGSADKAYDIAPIFPLSADKCAKYGGEEKGSGVTASCMVTKEQCEKAAADWDQAMEGGGVNDAMRFSCE